MKLSRAALAGAMILAGLAGCGGGTASGPEWERVASMSQRRSYVAAAALGGLVYAAGGMVGETGRPLATFARYDPQRDRWETLPRLPVPTRAAAAAALGGRIWVVGGTTAGGNTSSSWSFGPAERRWRSEPPLPRPVFNHSAVALGGSLYVLGGFEGGRERRAMWRLDPGAATPVTVAPLPRATHAFAAVAFDGELWAIGGRRGEEVLREVWIYDPRRDRWRAGPPLRAPMELLGAAVEGDRIHAVWESIYQIYDRSRRTWTLGPEPGVTRHALEAFVLDGALYTVGGCTTALRDSPVVERLELESGRG